VNSCFLKFHSNNFTNALLNMPHPLLLSFRRVHTRGTGNNHWLISHICRPAASGEKLKSNAYLRGWSNGPWLPRLRGDL